MVTSAFARPTSSRRTMSLQVVAVLAALAVLLLGGVGPASAHEPIEEPVVLAPQTTSPGPDTSIASQAAGSHASSAMPWPILMMVIVGSAALAPGARQDSLSLPSLSSSRCSAWSLRCIRCTTCSTTQPPRARLRRLPLTSTARRSKAPPSRFPCSPWARPSPRPTLVSCPSARSIRRTDARHPPRSSRPPPQPTHSIPGGCHDTEDSVRLRTRRDADRHDVGARAGSRPDRQAFLACDPGHRRPLCRRRAVAADDLSHPEARLGGVGLDKRDGSQRGVLEASEPRSRVLARGNLQDSRSRPW